MTTTLKTAALAAALATLALAPTARAAESTQCDRAALARAEAAVNDSEARCSTATGWGAQNRALALLQAATEQLRTARQLCNVTPASEDKPLANPFETDADPFAPVAHLPIERLEAVDPDTAAWLLVCGDSTAEECAGLAVEDEPKPTRW
jgi:hypothetical protein